MNEKMYRISNRNSLYFVWSDMNIEKINYQAQKHNERYQRYMKDEYKENVVVSECSITEPFFDINYRFQPLYSWKEAVDRYHCSYILETFILKQNFIEEHNITKAY